MERCKFDWAVAIFLLVCQKLERVNQVVAGSLWCCISAVRAVLHDENPVRGFLIVLAATSRTPPATLLLPKQSLQSLQEGFGDPPGKSCAMLCRPSSSCVYLTVAFSHLRTCPNTELAVSQELVQVICPNT